MVADPDQCGSAFFESLDPDPDPDVQVTLELGITKNIKLCLSLTDLCFLFFSNARTLIDSKI
jgi:hypothetical protein